MSTATQLILRSAARVFTGSSYALLGFEAAREPGVRVELAASTLAHMRKVLPLPQDNELVVRANGAIQGVAGISLSLGLYPRSSATILALSLVPTTLAGHGFWRIEDPIARKLQRTQFRKNMAMFGGLLITAALDGPKR